MKKIICLLLLSLTGGCVSLPKETVQLSGEMSTMISSAKAAHLALLDQYEAERRARVDDFMEAVWIPRFILNMAADGNLWGKTCKIANTRDSADELAGFVQAAAKQIAAKRKELTDALDFAMADLREAVRVHYETLELAQGTVHRNLRSIRANDEVTENLLRKNGIKPENLTPLREVSAKLDKLFR